MAQLHRIVQAIQQKKEMSLFPMELEKKMETEQISGGGKQKLSWEEMKKQQAAKRKLENELKRTEDEIAKREAKIEALNDELSKPEVASNSYELNKIHEEQMQEEAALEELYGKWEELSLQKDC